MTDVNINTANGEQWARMYAIALKREQEFLAERDRLEFTPGMTLRDWFAGLAMQGLLTHDDEGLIPETARDAYRYADAMLKAREAPE